MSDIRRPLLILLVAFLLSLTACGPRQNADGRWSEKDASQIIQRYYLAQNPGLNPKTRFTVEEITTEETWQKLKIQVFRISEDIYANETFILNGEILVQMGTAFGGSGVTDMLVTSLYRPDAHELVFIYNFGSGIHRTNIAAYLPWYDASRTLECDTSYLGDLELARGEDGGVTVLIIEPHDQQSDPVTLGSLAITKESSLLFLDLEINPSLPTDYLEGISVFK